MAKTTLNGGENKEAVSEPSAPKTCDNWMQFREHVWIISMDFMKERRLVVGTAYHKVELLNYFTLVLFQIVRQFIHSFSKA